MAIGSLSGGSTRRRLPTGRRPCRRPGRRADRRDRRRRHAMSRRSVQVSRRAVPSCSTSSATPSSTGVRMFPLSKSCTTVFCCVCRSGEEARDRDAGDEHGRDGRDGDPARCDRARSGPAATRAPSRRGSVGTRSGIDAKSSRYAGHAGISSRQNEPDSIDASGEKPFTTRNAASQPPRSAATAPRRTRTTAMQPGERRPLREPLAPEELAKLVHLVAPVLEVDVEVAVELQVDARTGPTPRRRAPRRGRTREPDRARAPSRAGGRASAGAIATPHARPSRQRRATTYASSAPAATSRFGGFSARGRADEHACEHGVRDTAGLQRAHDEQRAREDEHHRREVGHRGEPERLREELLVPALLVAVDEERDRGEGRDHPQERRPVAEEPPADLPRDGVHAVDGDRAEDEDLRDDEHRAAPGRTSAPVAHVTGACAAGQRYPISVGGSSRWPSSQPVVVIQIWSPPWNHTQPLCSTESARIRTRAIWPTMSVPTTARGRSRRRSTVCPPRRAAPTAVLRTDTRNRRAVPRDGALDALAQRRPRLEPEELARPRRRRRSGAAGRSASTCPRRSRPRTRSRPR